MPPFLSESCECCERQPAGDNAYMDEEGCVLCASCYMALITEASGKYRNALAEIADMTIYEPYPLATQDRMRKIARTVLADVEGAPPA
jgi:hypothetical protein